jgi:adenylate cyclase
MLFKQALALDPKAVNAVAGLAWSSAVLVLNAWSEQPAQDFAAAEEAAAQTLAIDPNNVVAHHVRGFLLRLQARPGAARDAFRTVVALDPNFAAGHGQLGVTELEVGRPEETFKAVERAIRLSPRDPNVGHWFSIAGLAELHLGRFAESAAWFARAVETDTGTPTVRQRAYFASALALAGRTADARAALAELLKAKPTATMRACGPPSVRPNRAFSPGRNASMRACVSLACPNERWTASAIAYAARLHAQASRS